MYPLQTLGQSRPSRHREGYLLTVSKFAREEAEQRHHLGRTSTLAPLFENVI